MLIEEELFGIRNKLEMAIARLKESEPDKNKPYAERIGYYLAFSGGKDSQCIYELAKMAGVKFDAHYSVTTIDPPDLVYFIKENYKDVEFVHPEKPLLVAMLDRGFPMRQSRWCCELYKENGGNGRTVITGIRAEESFKRSKRRMIEICQNKGANKIFVNPIFDWTEKEVWEFIKGKELKYCKLYDEGWKRIGCLMCPMAGKHRTIEAERYPKYTKVFIRHFDLLYKKRKAEGKTAVDRWNSGEEMFWWWLKEEKEEKVNPDQTVMFE
jgi:phosphoadenosine phosphosulfate reductase